MPEQHFTRIIEVFLNRIGKFWVNHTRIDLALIVLQLPLENTRQRIGPNATLTRHVRLPRINIKLHTADTRAVLATIVLLLHQEEQLVKAIQRCAVFFLIVSQWLEETDHCDAAFVLKKVAHRWEKTSGG